MVLKAGLYKRRCVIDLMEHIQGCLRLYLAYHRKNAKQTRSFMENCKVQHNHYGLEDWNSLGIFEGGEKKVC